VVRPVETLSPPDPSAEELQLQIDAPRAPRAKERQLQIDTLRERRPSLLPPLIVMGLGALFVGMAVVVDNSNTENLATGFGLIGAGAALSLVGLI
jgi:hypothetical protein